MAVEGTWDLRTSASPRSLCVSLAPSNASISTNPFDVASRDAHLDNDLVSVFFGTDRGSLHSRTYASPAAATATATPSPSRRKAPPQAPKESPRHVAPFDLNATLPGAIVAVIKGHHDFLLLVDDNRGTSAGTAPLPHSS